MSGDHNPLIVVVEDEAPIRRFIKATLEAEDFRVVEAGTCARGLIEAATHKPDLLILDLGLPDLDGQDVISAVRERSDVPIVVLSVRAGELDKVEALDRGANDYIVKPFGVAELMARVRAVLRQRAAKGNDDVVEAGSVQIDLSRRIVTRDGAEVHLSKREWGLLAFLASQPDHVLTHKQILKEVWGPAHGEDTAYLRVYVNQLRQKLEADPATPTLIVTDAGVGYRLKRGD